MTGSHTSELYTQGYQLAGPCIKYIEQIFEFYGHDNNLS